jgi:hypothetical protein
MALNINGRMKVKTLRSEFKTEFGLTLRIYDGRSFADEDSTLASIRKGDSKGGEFAPQRNTKIGTFEIKMMNMFGIKVQVSGSDDSYLCNDELTIAGAQEEDKRKVEKKEKKSASTNQEVLTSTEGSDINKKELDDTRTMYIVLVEFKEDAMDEAKASAAEDYGYDIETEDESEQAEIYANALATLIEARIGEDINYYMYKHICEPEDEQIADMEIFIKAGDKFVTWNALSMEDCAEVDYQRIPMYFVVNQKIELEESYFLTLSEECSEAVESLIYICPVDDFYVSQSYINGEYDEGYFSHDEKKYYMSTYEHFDFPTMIADIATVTGK